MYAQTHTHTHTHLKCCHGNKCGSKAGRVSYQCGICRVKLGNSNNQTLHIIPNASCIIPFTLKLRYVGRAVDWSCMLLLFLKTRVARGRSVVPNFAHTSQRTFNSNILAAFSYLLLVFVCHAETVLQLYILPDSSCCCRREHYHTDQVIPKGLVAFSDPSPSGRKFAENYVGVQHFLVYQWFS